MLEAGQDLQDKYQLRQIWLTIIAAINSHTEPQTAVECFFDLATTEEGFAEIVKMFLKNNPHLIPVLIQELEKEKTNPLSYYDVHLVTALIKLCRGYS